MIYNTYQDYRRAWNDAYLTDPSIPLNIDIELASLCNLTCPMCFVADSHFDEFISQKSSDGKKLKRLMPKEMAFKIIEQCKIIGVPALKFNWRGESTLHPHYSEIIEYARWWNREGRGDYNANGPFLDLLANTNANCSARSIDGLMACTKVMVSLDSMNEETYKQMRVGGSLKWAKETIDELVRRKHPNLWIRRVLTKLNKYENFYEAVKDEWGDSVKCSSHYCFDRNEKEKHEMSGCDHDEDMPRKYCGYPSQRMIITSRGLVYPCCLDLHETMPMGDISKNSIIEIWNNDAFRNLRKSLRSNDTRLMSDTCRNCQSWLAYDKPQRNYVHDVEMGGN